MRLRVVVAEAWRSLTASLSTTLASALTVLIGLFLVGLLIGLGTWARSWSEHAKSQLDILADIGLGKRLSFVVAQALGVDAAEGDPESPLRVSASGFREAGRMLGAMDVPTVLVQEGGYDLATLKLLVAPLLAPPHEVLPVAVDLDHQPPGARVEEVRNLEALAADSLDSPFAVVR